MKRVSNIEVTSLDRTGIRPDVLILDCETSEVQVILGSRKSLADTKFVIVETHWVAPGVGTYLDLLSGSFTFRIFG
jgi:hypothetical protein